MDHQQAKDEAAGLRAQAKRFREIGNHNRKKARAAKKRWDWIESLKADSIAGDMYLEAHKFEARAKELMAFAKLVARPASKTVQPC